MVKFKKAIDEVLESKKWLHFFPEGSMWFYYPDIRPLKPSVFNFAVRHNKPVIPMSISFRKERELLYYFLKNLALIYILENLFFQILAYQ